MNLQELACILKGVLREKRWKILDDLRDFEIVTEILFQENILSRRQYEKLKYRAETTGAGAQILDIVEQSGVKGYKSFLKAISEDYPWIAQLLGEAASEKGITGSILEEYGNKQEQCANVRNVSEIKLGMIPTEKELLHIAKQLVGEEWEMLGFELGLSTADIERCKHTSSNIILQVHSLLITWRRKNAQGATFNALQRGLINCEMESISL